MCFTISSLTKNLFCPNPCMIVKDNHEILLKLPQDHSTLIQVFQDKLHQLPYPSDGLRQFTDLSLQVTLE
jgi:hypothetical protein